LLEKFVALEPARVDARLALAAVQRERGRLDEALTVARAVLVKDPHETLALLEVGRIYRARGELDVTELVLEKARALLPADSKQSAPVYNELGLLALARGDTQLAFTHFAKAEALDARFTPAHVNQGSVLLRAGDYEAAERAYRAALVGEPREIELGSLDARIGLGIAQRGQGKYRDARATYEKVLEAHPSHLPAIYDLAVLLADFMDQRKEALPLFERYLAGAPKTDSHRESAERYLQDIRMAMGSTP
jgi:tetratricopeptide (TPR) repeat protein